MNYTEQQAEWITQQILQELATSKNGSACCRARRAEYSGGRVQPPCSSVP